MLSDSMAGVLRMSEGVDVGDDARGVVAEFDDRILSRVLSGGRTDAEC